jgi:hypothetical protein
MSTALATIDQSKYLALSDDALDIAELLDANMGSGDFSARNLASVKVPAGGGMTWTVPHPDGEQDTRELVGVILFAQNTRAYYPSGVGEGPAGPPDCSSEDGVTGVGSPGGACATCPLAQFGSAIRNGQPASGQACAAKKQLYMLLPDRILPVVVTAPATSLKAIQGYMGSLLQVGKPIYAVETKLSLKREERGGNKFSVIVAAKGGDLSPEGTAFMKALAAKVKSFISAAG